MKKILIALSTVVAFAACNGPEQNSTIGNSQDSTTMDQPTMSDSLTSGSSSSPGPDNSGSHPGAGTLTDTSLHGTNDSMIQTNSSKKDFKK